MKNTILYEISKSFSRSVFPETKEEINLKKEEQFS